MNKYVSPNKVNLKTLLTIFGMLFAVISIISINLFSNKENNSYKSRATELQQTDIYSSYGLPQPDMGEAQAMKDHLMARSSSQWATRELLAAEKTVPDSLHVKQYLTTAWLWFESGQNNWPDPYLHNCMDIADLKRPSKFCPINPDHPGLFQVGGYQAYEHRRDFVPLFEQIYGRSNAVLVSKLQESFANSDYASRSTWDYKQDTGELVAEFHNAIPGATESDISPNSSITNKKTQFMTVLLGKDPKMVVAMNHFAVSDDDLISELRQSGDPYGQKRYHNLRPILSNMIAALQLFDNIMPTTSPSPSITATITATITPTRTLSPLPSPTGIPSYCFRTSQLVCMNTAECEYCLNGNNYYFCCNTSSINQRAALDTNYQYSSVNVTKLEIFNEGNAFHQSVSYSVGRGSQSPSNDLHCHNGDEFYGRVYYTNPDGTTGTAQSSSTFTCNNPGSSATVNIVGSNPTATNTPVPTVPPPTPTGIPYYCSRTSSSICNNTAECQYCMNAPPYYYCCNPPSPTPTRTPTPLATPTGIPNYCFRTSSSICYDTAECNYCLNGNGYYYCCNPPSPTPTRTPTPQPVMRVRAYISSSSPYEYVVVNTMYLIGGQAVGVNDVLYRGHNDYGNGTGRGPNHSIPCNAGTSYSVRADYYLPLGDEYTSTINGTATCPGGVIEAGIVPDFPSNTPTPPIPTSTPAQCGAYGGCEPRYSGCNQSNCPQADGYYCEDFPHCSTRHYCCAPSGPNGGRSSGSNSTNTPQQSENTFLNTILNFFRSLF